MAMTIASFQCVRVALAGLIQRSSFPEIKETFQLFDKDGDGHISTEEVATVIRSAGFNLTDAEIKDIVDKCMVWDKDSKYSPEFFTFNIQNMIGD